MTSSAFTFTESTTIATVALAALAAAASWASVRQAAKIWRSSLLPDLHIQGLIVREQGTEHMMYAIHNAGGGLAKGTAFAFASGGYQVMHALGNGLMKSGDTVHVSTTLPPTEGDRVSKAIVICRDTRERSMAWSATGKHKRIRRWPWKRVHDLREVWHRFHPDIDIENLPVGKFRLDRPDG